MSPRHLTNSGILLDLPDGWGDITATLDDPNAPLTIAKFDSGVGALQISTALYKSGSLPRISTQDLSQFLSEFAATQKLESPFNRIESLGDTTILAENFRSGDDYIRVWYCTDGTNLALVTYICDWTLQTTESQVVEEIISSIHFLNPAHDQ
ncbi:MAG: hypothetical protein U0903_02390 [Planctomycetales bacterium]